MRLVNERTHGTGRLARTVELSRPAKQGPKWFDCYESHDRNARLTCRLFGNSPQTSYRWKRRHNPRHLGSLEDRSRRPRQVRQRSYSRELVAGVLRLREQYPSWGKDKLVVLLRQEGFECSASTVGGIVLRLKEDGVSLVSLAPLRSVLLHEHPA